MAITTSGEKNLRKALIRDLDCTASHARQVVADNWGQLFWARVEDWRVIRAEPLNREWHATGEQMVSLIEDNRLVATLRMPGAWIGEVGYRKAMSEYDAYIAANPIEFDLPEFAIAA